MATKTDSAKVRAALVAWVEADEHTSPMGAGYRDTPEGHKARDAYEAARLAMVNHRQASGDTRAAWLMPMPGGETRVFFLVNDEICWRQVVRGVLTPIGGVSMLFDAECPRCDYWIPGVALPAREDVALECPCCGERFTIPWESVIIEAFAAPGYEPVTGWSVPMARHDGAVFVVSTA